MTITYVNEIRRIFEKSQEKESIFQKIDDTQCFRSDLKHELKHFLSRTFELNFLLSNQQAEKPLISNDIWIDVTHTIDFPYTSGVQRVVRSIATILVKEPNIKLVRFVHDLKAYRYLEQFEIDHLLRVHQSTVEIKSKFNLKRFLISFVKSNLKKLVPNDLYDIIIAGYRVSISHLKNKSNRKYSIPVPAGNIVIVPEVAGVPKRVETLAQLARVELLKFVPIFYDIIPLKRPDLAVFGDDFSKYLEIFHFADKISCISNSVRNDLIKYFNLIDKEYRAENIKSHLLGCDVREMKPPINSSYQNQNKKILLCVGSIEKRKNQLMVVKSLVKLKDLTTKFKLVFVGNDGPGYEDFSEEIMMATQMGFDVEVHLRAKEDQLNDLYYNCDATIFCSLEEGFGLPILESRGYGKVCLTSDKGSMREIGDKAGNCIFVNPEQVESIAAGMREIITEGEDYKKAMDTLRQQVNWPTWKEYAHELLKFARETN